MFLTTCGQEPKGNEWRQFTAVNHIQDLILFENQLLAATDGGVAVWDVEQADLVDVWTSVDGLLHNVTHAIELCEWPEPVIVVGTEAGVSMFNPANGEWENLTAVSSPMSSSDPVVELACTDTHLAIAYDTEGLDLFDVRNNVWIYYPLRGVDEREITAVSLTGREPTIWVAHRDAVSRIQGSSLNHFAIGSKLDDVTTEVSETSVRSIAITDDGTVWLGTLLGLTRVSPNGIIEFFAGRSIRDYPNFTRVDSIAVDDAGFIWTNTAFGGVCQFDPAKRECQVSYDDELGMVGQFNNTLVVGENGRIYYGSNGSGISAFDGERWSQWLAETSPPMNVHRAIVEGEDGTIWLGGPYGGYRVVDENGIFSWQSLAGIPTPVNAFLEIPQGMWVGHDAGASFFSYDADEWAHLGSNNLPGIGLAGGRITAIAQDSNNHFWFGSAAGLTIWDGNSFTYADLLKEDERAAGMTPHLIHDLHWDGRRMWIATNRALFHIEADQGVTQIDLSEMGIEDSSVVAYAVVEDENGRILIAANQNIIQLEDGKLTQLHAAEAHVRTLMFGLNGEIWAGLADDQVLWFDGDSWQKANEGPSEPVLVWGRAMLIDQSGTFWFASGNGGGVTVWNRDQSVRD